MLVLDESECPAMRCAMLRVPRSAALSSGYGNMSNERPAVGHFSSRTVEGPRGLDQQRSGEQLSARSLSTPRSTRSTGRSYPWRQLIHELRPLLLDQHSHIVGDF